MSNDNPINSKCDTCLRICDITNAMCRACHDGSNWIEGPRREVPATQTARSCDTCSYLVGKCPPCDDDMSGYAPSAVFDEERIDVVGANGNDGLHYGESRLNAFDLPYAQSAMNALHRAMLDDLNNVSLTDEGDIGAKVKSDGSTARYYELPDGATELQDLISFKNMNSQIGEIFRASYRYGEVAHSEKLRDAKKIKFYAEAEIARLEKYVAMKVPK